MKHLTKFLNPILTENLKSDAIYEVIENEVVEGRVIKGLDISGSLLSLTIFKNCVFESCVFFGTRIENCNFIGTTFKNCKFQFSAIENSQFMASTFENCEWELSPIKNSQFNHSFLDVKTAYYINKHNNTLDSCSIQRQLDWSQALKEDLPLEKNSESKLEETIMFFQDWAKIAS